jgi:RNA polymerase sigma factor (sigma-70 family)
MEKGAGTDELRDERIRELTAAMANGSESAYREFYESYFDRLFRHLLVLARGDENLARELVQRVLLRVVRYVKGFENERVLWAWLKQLARSCHIDWLRRAGREPKEISVELLEEVLAQERDADQELLAALECGLGELEPSERELVCVAYFDEWPQKKIAESWKTTPKAIESRLARVRQKLRKLVLEKLKDYALL